MLKLKLPQSEFDALRDDLKTEYQKQADGTYMLHTDVAFEDVTPIKNALNAEKQQRLAATTRAETVAAENAELKVKVAGNVTDLEKSWKQREEAAVTAEREKAKALRTNLQTLLVDDVANRIAKEVSDAPELLLPHIRHRITMEETSDGRFITRFLDKDGKASALGEKEFSQEIVDNPVFAKIVIASKASGGGAQGSQQKSGGGAKALKDMTEAEQTALFHSNRAEYDRLVAESKKK